MGIDRREFTGLLLGAAALTSSFPALAQDAAKLKIATIGAGKEGGALGTLYAKLGHKVMFSSRNPDQLKDLVASAGPNASAGTVSEAVAFGDIVMLVVPYPAVEGIGKDYGKALATKVLVMDVSNPVPARDGAEITKWVADQGGAGLATAKLIPGAKLVRAFNNLGSGTVNGATNLVKERPASDVVGIPYAGDDAKALALTASLIKEAHFEPVLIGGLVKGKYLVPGSAISGVHTPDELRKIAATLT